MRAVTLSAGSALRLELALEEPRFGMGPERLFSLALRRNPNRAFLFVSKVLGKHLPIRPAVLPAAGKLLSLALEGAEDPGVWPEIAAGAGETPFPAVMEALEADQVCLGPEDRTVFVGFAETATGLARSAAACYRGESAYISTTRLPLAGPEALRFEESHSHAKTHWLCLDPADPFLRDCRRVVILDDEFTTGRTALRLIEALHRALGVGRFVLLSLLDWSPEGPRRELAERLGIDIQAISLLRGSIQGVEAGPGALPLPEDFRGRDCPRPPERVCSEDMYLRMGRLLLSASEQARSRRRCRELAQQLARELALGPDTLALGTGELIYEPALIAGYLGAERFHSTTQSPICPIPGSAVESGVRFDPPDYYSAAGYLYNVPRNAYRRALLLAERETVRPQGLGQLADWLKSRGCEGVEVALL